MKNKKNIIIFALLFLLLILIFRVYCLRADYLSIVNNKIIIQEISGIKYKTIASNNEPYKIVIGDILGIDKKSYNFVDKIDLEENRPSLLIPGIKKGYDEINSDNFLYLIANKNNVFIPDNFCTKKWPNDLNGDLYKNSNITRGQFCSSEDEVVLIDKLIKQYHPYLIEVYYSNETYKKFLKGFLIYLDEFDIQYKLIKTP